ncbi:uncharacterized protein F4812DRAFT_142408 [Daldinia caldariorum]|uniref:uncharacterized protein n=1 Tax=Daldinia caldariorum TaxID=326644 RepID=UPI00200760BA|nr:uncharacterized protein F4812DRAFT_142408 [Daldinia caldariorum]KAI1464853.1 hypothetical protein F4812DRAFT_142408 [Daldinia caldariorum]
MPPQTKVAWHQLGPTSAGFSKGDIEFMKIEEYLRIKWPCSDPMPAPFDPIKLEAVMQARFKSRNKDKGTTGINATDSPGNEAGPPDLDAEGQSRMDEQVSDVIYPEEANISVASVFAGVPLPKPIDSGEQFEGYDMEVTLEAASSGNISQVSLSHGVQPMAADMIYLEPEPEPEPEPEWERERELKPVRRGSAPRVGSGSKPPLSRSAFSNAPKPCAKDRYLDKKPCLTLAGYPRPPRYFPFRSKIGSNK